MRIYEIVIESQGENPLTHDRYRVATESFDKALSKANRKIKGKKLQISSIELIADTEL